MVPLGVQNGILLVSIGMLVITIVINLFSSGKKWGSLKATVVQHGEAIDGISSVLFKEDGSHNFVTKLDFDDHTKRCPQLICNKINDVKSLVQINAGKLESNVLLGVRMEEIMKGFEKSFGQQQGLVTQLSKSVNALQLQLAVLKGQKWDGRERRIFAGADT